MAPMRTSACVQVGGWRDWITRWRLAVYLGVVLWIAVAGLTACVVPPSTVAPAALDAPADLTEFSAWDTLAPGLERRLYTLPDRIMAQILALRVDPAHFEFRAHYRPGEPLRLEQWQLALPDAAVIVNANFFDPEHRVLGLLVTDGVTHGIPYTGRGGWFAVQNGVPHVRSTTAQPYNGEPLEQAVQAFPMLVQDGRAVYADASSDRVTRRTAIGQDAQGRIVLLVTPSVGVSLTDLSAFLAASDMELINAFNLDGGGSTLLGISRGASYRLISRDPVPAILAVHPRP